MTDIEAALARQRAAIVAFLRHLADQRDSMRFPVAIGFITRQCAELIERRLDLPPHDHTARQAWIARLERTLDAYDQERQMLDEDS